MCDSDGNKTIEITESEDINTEMPDVDESNKEDEDNIEIRDNCEEVTDDDYEILGAVDRDTLLQDAADYTKSFTFTPGQGKVLKVYLVMMIQSI